MVSVEFNKFSIIQYPQARLFVGFQKHLKAKANRFGHAKYTGEMKIPYNLLQKMKNIQKFRLTY